MKFFIDEDTGLYYNENMTVIEPTEEMVTCMIDKIYNCPQTNQTHDGLWAVFVTHMDSPMQVTNRYKTEQEAIRRYEEIRVQAIKGALEDSQADYKKFIKNFEKVLTTRRKYDIIYT